MNINGFSGFLDKWFTSVNALVIDLSQMNPDHIGYSVSSKEEYNQEKETLLKIAELVREAIVSNRRVGVFKFNTPLKYDKYIIDAIELIEPKEGEKTQTGFEHAEFTAITRLHELVSTYPDLPWNTSSIDRLDFPRLKIIFPDKTEVKFNNQPIKNTS